MLVYIDLVYSIIIGDESLVAMHWFIMLNNLSNERRARKTASRERVTQSIPTHSRMEETIRCPRCRLYCVPTAQRSGCRQWTVPVPTSAWWARRLPTAVLTHCPWSTTLSTEWRLCSTTGRTLGPVTAGETTPTKLAVHTCCCNSFVLYHQ